MTCDGTGPCSRAPARAAAESLQPAGDLVRLDQEVDPLVLDGQADTVAVVDGGQRSADRRLWRDMQHDGAERRPDMRASEMRTMSLTPACASFFGMGR